MGERGGGRWWSNGWVTEQPQPACLPACWLHRAALRGDLRACLLLPPTRRAGITISTGAGLCEVHWPGQAVVMTQPRINQVRLPCRSIVARTCGATLPLCAHCHCMLTATVCSLPLCANCHGVLTATVGVTVYCIVRAS